MGQLGEAAPDVTHLLCIRKAGFNLEVSLLQYIHNYATLPIEIIKTSSRTKHLSQSQLFNFISLFTRFVCSLYISHCFKFARATHHYIA